MVKHGIFIATGRKWNTKTIWNNGHRMITYRYIPKHIEFVSLMVNDTNQHLCGGWRFTGMEDTNALTEHQLVSGKKPLGIMYFDDKTKSIECTKRLRKAGLVVRTKRSYEIEACHNILVRDIGDMKLLTNDYEKYFGNLYDISDQIKLYSNRKLSTFFGKWDHDIIPIWLTGLILGYPIENTISIYAGGVA